MKLKELKQEVYECWEDLSKFHDAIVQPETFKPEMRQFGDLRRKSTWEKAYAAFFAKVNWDSGITEHTAIAYVFNFTPDRWDYELRHEILDQYLAIPGAMEFIAGGLEQIYRSSDRSDQECADAFLEVVSEQSRRGTAEFPVGSLRRLARSR